MKDAIIVLGSGVDPEGNLLPKGRKRVEKAAALFHEKKAQQIVLSGKYSQHLKVAPPVTEAEAMKRCLEELGVPERYIVKEESSQDTLGNLFFSYVQYMEPRQWSSVYVVTSDYHAERVAFLCSKVLGQRVQYELVEVDSSLPSDELRKKKQREQEKMDFVLKELASLPDGDTEVLQHYMYAVHPAYKKT